MFSDNENDIKIVNNRALNILKYLFKLNIYNKIVIFNFFYQLRYNHIYVLYKIYFGEINTFILE